MLRTFYKLYISLIISVAIAAFVVTPVMQYLFVAKFTQSDAQDVRATMYVMRDMLAEVPVDQRKQMIDDARAPFALIDFDLTERSKLNLSEKDRRALDSGYSVAVGSDSLLLAIPGSDQVLHTNQMDVPGSGPIFRVMAWVTIVFVVFGGLFLWLRSHWRDLEALREAAQRFGDGQLHVRSGLPSRSSVSPLATRFDSMASRIQTLVSTQSEMINAISHELRTPIARFGFALALVKSAKDEDERRRYLDTMSHDIGELDQLVSELLSYGALGQPGRDPESCEVDVTEFIDSVTGSLSLEMELREIQCHVSIFPIDATATIDPKLTARALINIVRNALRYGRERIDIKATVDREMLVIHVDDDGIGVPEADRKSIFEPFHRLDRSRDRNTGGFGLGLAIVRRAITSQGGSVAVGDSPTGGARFTLLLPVRVA
ncbi:MAG: Sensor protein RstB [Luteibacter sp.]|uniref:ATP-binding protein n=1 Tax=Luteibacter sp. TaxID=1886636 RepID=UPI00137C8BA3|nr:ATP-binding protein [Luteibacter sp.]KAF1006257.1 MAG: Sensor protein RstB [Luteibacter sp.]